ncbi:hypothetical protein [Nonomuraea zeae]|uniref:Uncharacterized protein n=1 Tax=Nonomuraea zeae TaxID=1642303 RepID=A0A5S4G6R7_9ACTN|nr:hypothetical protein [Nonomuraea zeae]TMR28716.1 hypothetical protein ETD85_34890 [Nonomuraea zeae]
MIKQRSHPTEAGDLRWAFGCAFPVIIALSFATLGTFFEIHLVARAHVYCAGDLSSGENFAGSLWMVSRLVLFPVVSVVSALVSPVFQMLARLPRLAGRLWLELLLLALTIAVSAAGPVALTLYDLATQGTPGDCVLPWWPSWLPA